MSDTSGFRGEDRIGNAPRQLDRTLDLLANDRRRTILCVLRERNDERIEFSDLVTEIRAREGRGHTVDRESVAIDLHHCQLPRLVDVGVVEYDQRNGVVEYHGDDVIEDFFREASLQS